MYEDFLKRILDFLAALTLSALLFPFLLIIALLIKIESPGPVFFTQKRGGRRSIYFTLYKFRSMSVDLQAEKAGFEPGTSKRITRIGNFLRKSKIDEIPQLINVIRGDMSLVGPRPEVGKYIDRYPVRWQKILLARPGITDPASIKFRNEENILGSSEDPEKTYVEIVMPEKMRIYEEYVGNISFCGDMKIIIRTFFAVIAG